MCLTFNKKISQNMVLNSKPLYGDCPDCKLQRTSEYWCKDCEIASFKENFHYWTSGNLYLDEFIRHTQLNANESMDYLEWIEFNQFDLIEYNNKQGAFSTVYSAIWMEGPRWNLDAQMWSRSGPIKVILKRLNDSQNMSQEFINQASILLPCLYLIIDRF